MPKGCLRGARFARNFFEKSFNSYLELELPQRSVTRRGTFWRAARAERSAHCKLRNDKVNSFLLFGNRTKINEKSPLFGGPYRNSDRQFFYSPKNCVYPGSVRCANSHNVNAALSKLSLSSHPKKCAVGMIWHRNHARFAQKVREKSAKFAEFRHAARRKICVQWERVTH